MEVEIFFWCLAILIILSPVVYFLGVRKASASVNGELSKLHSLPSFYGGLLFAFSAFPSIIFLLLAYFAGSLVLLFWPDSFASLQSNNAVYHYFIPIILMVVFSTGFAGGWRRINADYKARYTVESMVMGILLASSCVAIFVTFGIVMSLLVETLQFAGKYPFFDFLTGLNWSPQTALRSDQVGGSGEFGIIPLMTGTFLITVIAMVVAAPLGLMSAIYLSDYASPRFRSIAKPTLEILAGIPTVVYGFFAALTMAPFIRNVGESIGLTVASESALAAGVVMGIMIIPFISSLSDDMLNAVPQSLRDGSYGLGATTSETIAKVIFPAAFPGIMSAFLLAISRAVGETMIVVMAAGLSAKLTVNPLDAVTTVTVQIVTLLTGDQEFDSAKTLSAFALGLVLFVVTLALNVIALQVVRKYKEQYD